MSEKAGAKYEQGFTILEKKELAPETFYFKIRAPLIAKKIEAGQFVIVRPGERSERMPLSILGWGRDEGYIELIIMGAGYTSKEALRKNVGESFQSIVGPLGRRSHVEKYDGAAVLLGGGYGVGALLPTAEDLKKLGSKVIMIIGARSENLLLMEERARAICDEVYITTNDGSKGIKGFVTDALKEIIAKEKVSMTLSIGPPLMMRAVAMSLKETDIEAWVSLNAIMVDGTGMCGACRVKVGREVKFACFHGPDFDGKLVDFDELIRRQKMFAEQEAITAHLLD